MEIGYGDGSGQGIYRTPDSAGPFPAVLALGGSDGGTPRYFADLLVPEGFACLSLAYWATRGTQQWFTEIPLERVECGLRWLIGRPEIRTHDGRVALVGASRGGELALLVAPRQAVAICFCPARRRARPQVLRCLSAVEQLL